MKKIILLLLCTIAVAQTKSITIGKLTYWGTGVSGGNIQSNYQVSLNTTGITANPITFSNVILFVSGGTLGTQQSGFPLITTGPGCGQAGITDPCDLLFLGGTGNLLPACADQTLTQTCISIALQLVSATGKNFIVPLPDGEQFCAYGINNIFLLPKVGAAALDPQCKNGFCKGASVNIILHAAPVKTCK
jgi:hypothetical protein